MDTITLHPTTEQRILLERAAHLNKTSTEDFILDAACMEAQDAILDQTVFELDEDAFKAILEYLDRPYELNPGQQRLMNLQGGAAIKHIAK